MKKEGKKWMLVAIALLAMVTVALPLVGCKNDSVSEPVKYTVKFNKGENTEFTGTVPEDITVVSGTTLTGDQLEDLDDTTSYTFDGWHDGENKAKAGYEVKKNVTLTAKWTKKGTVANVSFAPKDRTVDAGTKVTLTTETEGATIWYHLGDEQWQEYTADTGIIINGDTTITAKATKDEMLPSGEFSASYHIHSFDETKWESDATDHWHPATCEHKDLKGSFAAHSFDWKVQTESTETAEGKLAGKCTVCGHEGEQDIPVGFAYVKGGTIEGAALPWNPTENYEKGVFIAGRTVTLSDFFIGKYEVTQAEYEEYCSYGSSQPSETYGDGDKYPAYYVSWYDAVVYCNKRSMAEGLTPCYTLKGSTDPANWGDVPTSSNNDSWKDAITCDLDAGGYRLPTEAEWEYAARGGDQTENDWNYLFSGANTAEGVESDSYNNSGLDQVGWYRYNIINGTTEDTEPSSDKPGYGTHQVGTKNANRLGIYDMSGNVWEWCWDWHNDDPKAGDTGGTSPVEDPTGPASGSGRVRRGGGWSRNASGCGVSYRYLNSPDGRLNSLGFRVVRPAK